MALPNFLGVGAAKAGTTTIHDILVQHPNLFLPEIKEAHFFDYPKNYKKGLGWYEKKVFGKCKNEKAIGEITPSYLYLEYVPERIFKSLGKDLRLIFVFRNPVDRAYSQYLMNVRREFETETFEVGIRLEKTRSKKGLLDKLHFGYLDRGYYATQLRRYLEYFPMENMFFVLFEEDILNNIHQTIKNILNFLNVEVMDLDLEIKSNPSSVPKSKLIRNIVYNQTVFKHLGKIIIPHRMTRKKIQKFLDKINQKPFEPEKLDNEFKNSLIKEYFMKDINELEGILKRDLSVWYKT
jgi:hypothetical protein